MDHEYVKDLEQQIQRLEGEVYKLSSVIGLLSDKFERGINMSFALEVLSDKCIIGYLDNSRHFKKKITHLKDYTNIEYTGVDHKGQNIHFVFPGKLKKQGKPPKFWHEHRTRELATALNCLWDCAVHVGVGKLDFIIELLLSEKYYEPKGWE
jgi:hypothetical protein